MIKFAIISGFIEKQGPIENNQGRLNMKVNRDLTDATVKLWLFAFQTGDVLKMCTEQLLSEYHVTTEQYDVLVGIKYLGDRVNITDIATWLKRSTNSISMLVDRMVKAGLVRRVRDRVDRRVVYVTTTSKAENILELASPVWWQLIKEILSPLSYEDRHTFISLFQVINRKALDYLNPGKDVGKIIREQDERHAKLMKRLPSYAWLTTPRAKQQGGKTRKAS
jgi:MarR family 2-MHQ and catechol resistance regulon transcriptional repressor